jgi:hypothetical protein
MCPVFRVFLLLMLSRKTQKTCQRLTSLCAESAPSSGCFYFLCLVKTLKRHIINYKDVATM